MLHAPTSPLVTTQVGACRTALDADLAAVNLTKQCDLNSQTDAVLGSLELAENVLVNDEKNLTKQCDSIHTSPKNNNTEQCVKQRRKRTKGTGNTATTGTHATRYRAYSRAVKNGVFKPTQYALVRHVHGGEKIGTETAQIFLAAMERDGLIQKGANGRYELI